MNIGDLASLISAIVALGSAVWAVRASRDADRHQREAAASAQRNADILAKQHELGLRTWTDQYFKDVRSWANEVCYTVSQAIHLVDLPNSNESANYRLDALSRLSAHLDTGRWYFPNSWSKEYGTQKAPAYRGVRQPVLDCVAEAYKALQQFDGANGRGTRDELVRCQREFVSHIQLVLDPRKRNEEIQRVLAEFADAEKLRTPREQMQKSSDSTTGHQG